MSFLPHFDKLYKPHLGARSESFRALFERLEAKPRSLYTIVETGATYLIPRPGAADLSIHGHSTVLFDRFVAYHDGQVYSVDNSTLHRSTARSLVSSKTTVECGDSVQYLRRLRPPQRIDCLYLDTIQVNWKDPHYAGVHALKELCAILSRLQEGCILLVDDNREGVGRGMYIRDLLSRLGMEPFFDSYQIAWELGQPQQTSLSLRRSAGLDRSPVERSAAERIEAVIRFRYWRSDEGERLLELLPGGRILSGRKDREELWQVDRRQDSEVQLSILAGGEVTARLALAEGGRWRGRCRVDSRVRLEMIPLGEAGQRERAAAREIIKQLRFRYLRVGHGQRVLELLPNGRVGLGRAGCEQVWFVQEQIDRSMVLVLAGGRQVTCRLAREDVDGPWRGRWLIHEKMPIELHPE